MCGIFGYFDFRKISMTDEDLCSMGDVIQYRGPDGLGYYHEAGRALGNQRLAILDVDHGQQPFYSDDGNVVVVQNGEIFNHIELAQSLEGTPYSCKTTCDTEVILNLYLKNGIEFIKLLNGMFSIAIYDKNFDQMYLIRDRVGEKPLYFYKDDDQLVFGSEIKSILQSGVPRDVNYKALDSYISYNYVVPPLTMFENISHVMPGTYLSISSEGEIEEKTWWSLSEINVCNSDEEFLVKELYKKIDDSTKIRLRADVPFGAFLSGGVDSSSVVGFMANHMEKPVKTFSIGFHDVRYDESRYAKMASERFSTEHTSEKVEANLLNLWPKATYHCDQPHGDVSFMPTYKVAELASKQVKMVLTGDGADELFAGYDKYKYFFDKHDIENLSDREFYFEYLESISLFKNSEKKQLYTSGFYNDLGDFNSYDFGFKLFEEVKHQDRINQVLYLDTKLLLPGNNLIKPDRMGMAASIENRSPFLDYRIVEFAFSMPGALKLNGGETKYILKKAVSNLIGNDLAYREKQMFTVPIGDWLKNELKYMVEDLMLSDKALARGYFDKDYVSNLYYEHCSGLGNKTREIRALMAIELWFREFID